MSYRDRDRVCAWLDAGHGEKLTTLDRAVLLMIAERANKDSGLSAPGAEDIAKRWGVIPKSIVRSISRLHRLELVDTVIRGRGQSRARYVLTGEVAPPTGDASSTPETSSSTPERSSSTPEGGRVLSESSRSSNGGMTTPSDDALDAPGLAAARRRGQELPDELVAHVAHTLGMTTGQATEWIGARLNGHTVRSVDKYIRTCVENYSPPAPRLTTPHLDLDDFCGVCGDDEDGNRITGAPAPIWVMLVDLDDTDPLIFAYCDDCFVAGRKASDLPTGRYRNKITGRTATIKPSRTAGRTQP